MNKQMSVVKHENNILPGFRSQISHAESTEDVKKFFIYSVRQLLVNIFQDSRYQDFEAIRLSEKAMPYYELDRRVAVPDEFFQVWKNSDLSHVIGRMAETAVHRHRHLEKKPEKTTKKIRN